jgi:hypothetical protein
MPKALDEFRTDPLARAVSAWLQVEALTNPQIDQMAWGDRLALAVPA